MPRGDVACYTVSLMQAVFMSDAHLVRPTDENYRRVEAFLAALPDGLERLFINGDFFDCWYGDNAVAERTYGPVLAGLDAAVRRGVRVTFIEGNHDMRLAGALGRRGYEVVAGEWRGTLGGRRVLAVHGDLVTGDGWYRLLHFALRSPVAAGLDKLLPAGVTMAIGLGMSTASRAREREYEAAVNRKLLDYGAKLRDIDVFITGHTHFPLDVTVTGPAGPVRVVNLGDWIRNFTYFAIDGDRWELRRG